MARLFRILRDLYLDYVRLKLYEYDGKLQVQVVVTDDQIFPGWRLHMAVSGCAQLYRGTWATTCWSSVSLNAHA